jgi:hypothetical protein
VLVEDTILHNNNDNIIDYQYIECSGRKARAMEELKVTLEQMKSVPFMSEEGAKMLYDYGMSDPLLFAREDPVSLFLRMIEENKVVDTEARRTLFNAITLAVDNASMESRKAEAEKFLRHPGMNATAANALVSAGVKYNDFVGVDDDLLDPETCRYYDIIFKKMTISPAEARLIWSGIVMSLMGLAPGETGPGDGLRQP